MSDNNPTFEQQRQQMVEKQLIPRDITDARVLAAMRTIPRHRFVTEGHQARAYDDGPLPIGYEQTISQPYIVALMTQALRLPADGQGTVLEIGTGSGYQAAVLSRLARHVYTIERIAPLAERARQVFADLGLTNITVRVDDGGYGWPEHAPYDGIITTAAAPQLPAPLIDQLKDDALLLAPIGLRKKQKLMRVWRTEDNIHREVIAPVAFVPLIGEHGWGSDIEGRDE